MHQRAGRTLSSALKSFNDTERQDFRLGETPDFGSFVYSGTHEHCGHGEPVRAEQFCCESRNE
jgi:hypothetical protein